MAVLNIKDYGYKVPKGAVYIGRAMVRYNLPQSKWANPYKIGQIYKGKKLKREDVLQFYRIHLAEHPELNPKELKGMDICCWCHYWDGKGKNPEFCHGDILWEIANE